MSPTASEKVPNHALSATELRQLLSTDFERLLDNLSLLQSCSSFARVGWDLRIAIHIDNAMQGEHGIQDRSKPVAGNIINGSTGATPAARREPRPELAAVTTIPVPDASDSAQLEAKSLHRDVDSPNVERLRNGLPVPIERRQADSTTVLEHVSYPPDDTLGDGAVVVSDVGHAAAGELGIAGVVHAEVVDDAQAAETAEAFKARIAREADVIEQQRIDEIEAARVARESQTARRESEAAPEFVPIPVHIGEEADYHPEEAVSRGLNLKSAMNAKLIEDVPAEMTELTDPDDIIAELNAEGDGGRA